MAKCKGTVYNGWQRFQCGRKAGHGPDGAYCAQNKTRNSIARLEDSLERARAALAWGEGWKGGK